MLTPDQGYFFGMGAFETVAVEEGNPVLLEKHYERLFRAVDFFHLELSKKELEEKVGQALDAPFMKNGRKVLKITVSEKNLLVTTRENTYGENHYKNGFTADYSCVRRNETSPFTYHKTLNYGDCLREKHLAHERGIDEPIFLNTKDILAENNPDGENYGASRGSYHECILCQEWNYFYAFCAMWNSAGNSAAIHL